jgi:hypothetical protein
LNRLKILIVIIRICSPRREILLGRISDYWQSPGREKSRPDITRRRKGGILAVRQNVEMHPFSLIRLQTRLIDKPGSTRMMLCTGDTMGRPSQHQPAQNQVDRSDWLD